MTVPRPFGVTLLTAFFAVATLICSLTVISLAFPGGPVDVMWRLKPSAGEEFRRMGIPAIFLMKGLAAFMVVTGVGLWTGRRWGWTAAIVGLAINGLSDGAHAMMTPEKSQLIGVPIAALLIWYLLRSSTQRYFVAR